MQLDCNVVGISQHKVLSSSYNTLLPADKCASCDGTVLLELASTFMLQDSNCIAITLHTRADQLLCRN